MERRRCSSEQACCMAQVAWSRSNSEVTDKSECEDSSLSESESNEDVDMGFLNAVLFNNVNINDQPTQPSMTPEEIKRKLLEFYSEESSDYYDEYKGQGLMIVIQNKDFTKSDQRQGGNADNKMLKKTFSKLGFKVKSYKDLEAEEIDKKLKQARDKYIDKDTNCFACVIISHGNYTITQHNEQKDSIVGVDEEHITVEYIMKLFNDDNCPYLIGKPRLFFIQACRGKKVEKGVDIKVQISQNVVIKTATIVNEEETFIDAFAEAKSDLILTDTIGETPSDLILTNTIGETPLGNTITYPSPCYADSLIMFSSPPGYASFSRKGGSIFISCLCHEFKTYSTNEEYTLHQRLTRVAQQMAFEYKSSNTKKKEHKDCKVVPCIHSCLTKDVKFKISS